MGKIIRNCPCCGVGICTCCCGSPIDKTLTVNISILEGTCCIDDSEVTVEYNVVRGWWVGSTTGCDSPIWVVVYCSQLKKTLEVGIVCQEEEPTTYTELDLTFNARQIISGCGDGFIFLDTFTINTIALSTIQDPLAEGHVMDQFEIVDGTWDGEFVWNGQSLTPNPPWGAQQIWGYGYNGFYGNSLYTNHSGGIIWDNNDPSLTNAAFLYKDFGISDVDMRIMFHRSQAGIPPSFHGMVLRMQDENNFLWVGMDEIYRICIKKASNSGSGRVWTDLAICDNYYEVCTNVAASAYGDFPWRVVAVGNNIKVYGTPFGHSIWRIYLDEDIGDFADSTIHGIGGVFGGPGWTCQEFSIACPARNHAAISECDSDTGIISWEGGGYGIAIPSCCGEDEEDVVDIKIEVSGEIAETKVCPVQNCEATYCETCSSSGCSVWPTRYRLTAAFPSDVGAGWSDELIWGDCDDVFGDIDVVLRRITDADNITMQDSFGAFEMTGGSTTTQAYIDGWPKYLIGFAEGPAPYFVLGGGLPCQYAQEDNIICESAADSSVVIDSMTPHHYYFTLRVHGGTIFANFHVHGCLLATWTYDLTGIDDCCSDSYTLTLDTARWWFGGVAGWLDVGWLPSTITVYPLWPEGFDCQEDIGCTGCCDDVSIPRTLNLTISSSGTGCECVDELNVVMEMTNNGGAGIGIGTSGTGAYGPQWTWESQSPITVCDCHLVSFTLVCKWHSGTIYWDAPESGDFIWDFISVVSDIDPACDPPPAVNAAASGWNFVKNNINVPSEFETLVCSPFYLEVKPVTIQTPDGTSCDVIIEITE